MSSHRPFCKVWKATRFFARGRWLLAAAVFVAITLPSATNAVPADNGEALSKVSAIWNQWDASVKSLEIEGYKFIGSFRSPENKFTRQGLEGLVYGKLIPLVEKTPVIGVSGLRELTLPLFRENSDRHDLKQPLGSWRPFTFVEDSGRIRVDDVLLGDLMTTIRKDGEEQQYLEGVRQAELHPAQTSYLVEDRNRFLYRPPNHWLAKPGRSAVDVDSQTGFVARFTILQPEGQFAFERIQSLPLTVMQDVPVPQLIVEARYFPGTDTIKLLTIYVINQVHLNREIDHSRFKLAVPAGTTIVDRSSIDEEKNARFGRPRHRLEVVRDAVSDVDSYAERPDFGRRTTTPQLPKMLGGRPSSIQVVLIVANVIAIFILLFTIAWRRRHT